VRTGHFCCKGPQGWQWASFEAAARNDAALRGDSKAKAAWEAVVERMQKADIAPVPAERPRSAQTVWKAADLRPSPFEATAAAAPAVDPAAAAALAADLHAARAKGAWSIDATSESETRVTEWRTALDACITSGLPNAREWDHGVPNVATFSEGARVVYELGGETASDGGQAGWGFASGFELDEDGCIAGWEERARAMACLYDVDGDGYIVHSASGSRVSMPEVPGLPVMLQLLVRGRWALGDVEVRDCAPDKTGKSEKTHVNVQAAARALAEAIRLQCQYDPTHAAATDGTKATKTGADGGTYVVIARAAVLNDGTTLGGTITEDDAFLSEHRTTYLAEKAATDDVLDALPAGSRVVLWLDSTSPQHALRRFRASPARRKRQFHAAGRHAATSALLQRHELVVYHWQMSHVGEPANEWADKAADAAADAEEMLPMVEPRHDYASMLFPRDGRSTRSWAVKRADALVAGWLRRRRGVGAFETWLRWLVTVPLADLEQRAMRAHSV
jgi:ribonuclease HI